jgi:hypothetical protein
VSRMVFVVFDTPPVGAVSSLRSALADAEGEPFTGASGRATGTFFADAG